MLSKFAYEWSASCANEVEKKTRYDLLGSIRQNHRFSIHEHWNPMRLLFQFAFLFSTNVDCTRTSNGDALS